MPWSREELEDPCISAPTSQNWNGGQHCQLEWKYVPIYSVRCCPYRKLEIRGGVSYKNNVTDFNRITPIFRSCFLGSAHFLAKRRTCPILLMSKIWGGSWVKVKTFGNLSAREVPEHNWHLPAWVRCPRLGGVLDWIPDLTLLNPGKMEDFRHIPLCSICYQPVLSTHLLHMLTAENSLLS